ncbi:hypothetical protein PACTADRAFT_50741 [Pachysolen tannophilus NRRL Y-2460]|uniref:U3 small nucleolar RNA-associated protein 25 n=1 Tax=Pachysolen tannophilus NRRL Y-2460 TaxID=669874 RepID=A0A1E4TT11_PACTA|nr:hypothetical protein PACTADRAFT_50741 [Pachysolen tannophilus NRRL Y-2460]
MGASQSRKQERASKRSLTSADGGKLVSETNDSRNGTKRTKHGRKELRTITRTTRRGGQESNSNDDVANGENKEYEHSDIESLVSDGGESENGNEQVNDTRKAYDSLLTLLKYDHKESRRETIGTKKIEANFDDETYEEDVEEIAGIISEGEEAEDDAKEKKIASNANDKLTVDEIDEDDLDEKNMTDPFNFHFNDENALELKISNYEKLLKDKSQPKKLKLVTKLRLEDEEYVLLNHIPNIEGEEDESLRTISSDNLFGNLSKFNVKSKVLDKLKDLKSINNNSQLLNHTVNSIFQYKNLNLQYYENDLLQKSYQDYYLLHVLNHVCKTRDRILKNNNKKQIVMENLSKGLLKPEEEPEFRDQGYTRPKVLILLPTRNFAYELVMKLIKLSSFESVENKSKFIKQFYSDFEIDNTSKKSKDFRDFFKGNTNDFFCLGLKFTRKTLKLYSAFKNSDIIIASPLGLKMILENEGKSRTNNNNKDQNRDGSKPSRTYDSDFLSSIEVVVFDKAHGFLMQNWEHVTSIISQYLNKTPKKFHDDVDFSRIRMWTINDQYKFITQFLCFSKYATPELNNLMNFQRTCNIAGNLIVKPIINEQKSILSRQQASLKTVGILNNDVRLRQYFQKFQTASIIDEPNDRFNFFKNVVLSQIMNKSSYDSGFLIYVPSYLDFLRLVNFFKTTSTEVLSINEYSSQSQLTRNRSFFMKNSKKFKIMLYTERLHFYKRYEIKGVKNMIFYGLPSDPSFYSDCIDFIIKHKLRQQILNSNPMINNTIEEKNEETEEFDLNLSMVRSIYSKFDLLKLEKIVGLQRANVLCNSNDETFEFR